MTALPDDDACYAALSARDPRFDGRFFFGVASTGIYCRPVCSARTPARRHCRFFASAAAAERAGMRPCLRCRPELAPGHAAVDACSRLARRAALMIEDAPGRGAAELARRCGITDRHLRRVFAAQFGVSPLEYALTQRLLLAKRLLTETAMPVIDVALASGFASLRRFNAAFVERYRLVPGDLRRASRGAGEATGGAFEVLLAVRPPYDWVRLARFLGARAIDGVEAVVRADGRPGAAMHWTRAVRIDGVHGPVTGWIEVRPERARHALRVRLSPSLAPAVPAALAVVRRVFDVVADPVAIGATLGALAEQRPGLRLPGSVNGFETAVRAVLGQQVSVAAARTLAARFAAAFGDPLPGHPHVNRLFPEVARVAALEPAAIASLGVVGQRARAIVALAHAVAHDGLALDAEADVERTLARLRALPGIGEWTAQYVAMRALGWPDAFPAADHGVLAAMALPGGRAASASSRVAAARAEAWRPWRAYAVMHLWSSLEEEVT